MDGYCDRLVIRREHAFLVPEGTPLPFVPKGKCLGYDRDPGSEQILQRIA